MFKRFPSLFSFQKFIIYQLKIIENINIVKIAENLKKHYIYEHLKGNNYNLKQKIKENTIFIYSIAYNYKTFIKKQPNHEYIDRLLLF